MRRFFLLLTALAVTGCGGNLVGPFRNRPARVDERCLSIPEQETRGRERLSVPVEWPDGDQLNLAPRTYIDRPSPTGR
jgi:hypothetical protein